MMLQDRSGGTVEFLAQNAMRFLAEASKRPELAAATRLLARRAAALCRGRQRKGAQAGRAVSEVYKTLQTFLGGAYVNYFTRFGRPWRVFVQAAPEFRTKLST